MAGNPILSLSGVINYKELFGKTTGEASTTIRDRVESASAHSSASGSKTTQRSDFPLPPSTI